MRAGTSPRDGVDVGAGVYYPPDLGFGVCRPGIVRALIAWREDEHPRLPRGRGKPAPLRGAGKPVKGQDRIPLCEDARLLEIIDERWQF